MIKLLAIDDQNDNLVSLRAVLKGSMKNADLLTATTGGEGIRLAHKHLPDTILLDIIMPGMDGYEVCKELKRDNKTKHIPIIMLTAVKTDMETRVSCLEMGADAFVAKPIVPIELTAQIRVMLRIKRAEDKLRSDKKKLKKSIEQKSSRLLESEQKYKTLYDFAPLPYQSLNSEGNIIDINPEWLNMLGYDRSEVVGKWIGDFLHQDDRKTFKKNFPVLKKIGLVHNIPFKLKHKNGLYFDIALEGRAAYTDDGVFKQTYCVFQNVTKRKRSEDLRKAHLNLIKYSLNHTIGDLTYKFLDIVEELTTSNISFFYLVENIRVDAPLGGLTGQPADNKGTTGFESRNYPFSRTNALADCINKREAIINNEYENARLKKESSKERAPISRELLVPIFRGDEIKCIVGVGNKEIFYDDTDIEIVKHLAEASLELILRKQSEKKLKDNERLLRKIAENYPNSFLSIINEDFSIGFSAGQEFSKQKLDPDDFVGLSLEQVFDDKAAIVKHYYERTFMGEEQSFELFINKQFQLYKTVPLTDDKGGIHQILSVAENITQRRLTELALEKSEHQYKTLFENAGDGIIIIDKTGNIIIANESFAKMHGHTMSEIKNLNIKELDAPQTKLKVPSRLKKVLMGETQRFEIEHYHKNGQIITMDIIACPIEIEGSTKIVAFHRDVTLQKKTENKLRLALEKVTESDRLKTAFLHNVSHEIRTPMSGIMGFAGLLKKPDLSREIQDSYLDVILKSGNRMLNTLNAIVDISMLETKQTKNETSKFDVNAELLELKAFFEKEANNKGIDLFIDEHPGGDVFLETDRQKFYAILSNLIKNAIKYSNKGQINIGYAVKYDCLEFYVKDQGIGIPANRQKAIFERFVQADIEDRGVYEGSGLGLSIASGYIELMGGEIWVESEVGLGSVFYFTLARNLDPIEGETQINETMAQKQPLKTDKKLKILIVEDEEVSDMYITIVLNELNCDILHAKNGMQAVSLLATNPDTHIILMDIKMPVMDGYQAVKEIRKFNKDVKIIAQTAYALVGDREKALEAGCNDYIAKPIDKDKIIVMIESLVGG
ncbi:MAG: response regulator [Chlorobi bacterium]|nr:response regulator [Chlorobiota bacterium]